MNTFNRFRFELLRWSMYLLLAVVYMLVFFHRMAPGVISGDLMSAFGTSGASLGTLSAIYFLIYFIMQIPAGVLADTIGTRTIVTAGCILSAAGSILFSSAGSFASACAGRFLVGFGVSLIFINIMKFNSLWFKERQFAIMSGVTLFIGNVGAILSTGPLSLVLKSYSWRTVFFSTGVFTFILAGAVYVLVRNRPDDVNFPLPHESASDFHASGTGNHWLHDLRGVITNISLWPGFWSNFGVVGGMYAFMGLWGVPYLRDVFSMNRDQAAGYITVMMLTFSFGGLFFGWISDRIGKRKPVLVASAVAYLVSWFMFMYMPWKPGLSGYCIFGLLGFTGTGCILTFACAKEITHIQLSGMSTSLVNTGSFIGTLIMQPLFGFVMDRFWDGTLAGDVRVYSAACYRNGFILMVIFAVISLVAAFRIKETGCRNIYGE